MDFKQFENEQNLRIAIESIKDNLDLYRQMFDAVATLRREYYLKCVEQGFTPDEALGLATEYKPFGDRW